MKIAIVVETFARDMGYVNNTLPKYIARAGEEVHVITTDLAPYHHIGSAKSIFGDLFATRNLNQAGSCQQIGGYTVHTLPHRKLLGYQQPVGLEDMLRDIRPDLVCTFQAAGWIPLQCARFRTRLGYRLVIGSHMGKTVFQMSYSWLSLKRLRSFLLRTIPGWYVASQADHCVVPTEDCAEVVSAHFGIPADMVRVMNLPVDTDFFYPKTVLPHPSQIGRCLRGQLRKKLGIRDEDFLCVYSGKFGLEKNAFVLAQAVDRLREQGHAVRALFIGAGEQEALIRSSPSAVVIPFMPISQLGDYYRASDIGVWMNESISFLDGACCGLPLLLSDVVKDISHLREFSRIYRANDPDSLAAHIKVAMDPVTHSQQSALAAELGELRFSGVRYAEKRLEQFRQALAPHAAGHT